MADGYEKLVESEKQTNETVAKREEGTEHQHQTWWRTYSMTIMPQSVFNHPSSPFNFDHVLRWILSKDSPSRILDHELIHLLRVFIRHLFNDFSIDRCVLIGLTAHSLSPADGRSPNVTTTLLAHYILEPRYQLTVIISLCVCSVSDRLFLLAWTS